MVPVRDLNVGCMSEALSGCILNYAVAVCSRVQGSLHALAYFGVRICAELLLNKTRESAKV